MLQPGRAESLSVPAFYDHNRAINKIQIGRFKDERKLRWTRFRIWIKYKKIDIVIVLSTRLADVFAMLPHQKFAQLKILADNRFADSAHLIPVSVSIRG